MALQYTVRRLFVATTVFGLYFGLARPTEVVPAIAAFAAAASVVGLILLGTRANIGIMGRSALWTGLGMLGGSLLSPSPPLHPPLTPLFGGALAGWAVGAALQHHRSKRS